MKEVIISADGDSILYSVPDAVANDLRGYCIEFCDKWMKTSPHAKKYRRNGGFCFDQTDFIEYLNTYVFPEEKSRFVKNLGPTEFGKKLPSEYRDLPYFNF